MDENNQRDEDDSVYLSFEEPQVLEEIEKSFFLHQQNEERNPQGNEPESASIVPLVSSKHMNALIKVTPPNFSELMHSGFSNEELGDEQSSLQALPHFKPENSR